MIFGRIKFDDRTISKEERATLRDLWKRERKRLPRSAKLRLLRDGLDRVASIRWHEDCWRGLEDSQYTYAGAIADLVNHICHRIAARKKVSG